MDTASNQSSISAIVPTHNRGYIIDRTIDSILQQSYSNLEVIIVDDCSNDNTEEIVRSIADPRIRYIRHETNQGASIARNTGVQAARGDYVAFLDSDDVWLPNKLECQLASLQNQPNPEKVVGYTQVTNIESDGVLVQPIRSKNQDEPVADYLFANGGLMQTGTLMLPRMLALDTPFTPGIVPHEDPDLCIRLEEKGASFVFVDQPLTTWHNEKKQGRATSMSDYQVSLNWIKGWESKISPQATKGFLVTEVVGRLIDSEQKKVFAEKILLDAFLSGVISINKFAVLSRRVILPKSWRENLQKLWKTEKS